MSSCVENRGLVENRQTGTREVTKDQTICTSKGNLSEMGFCAPEQPFAHTITRQSQGKIPSKSNLPYAKQTRSNYSILSCIIITHSAYRPSICSYQHSRCVSQLLSYVCKTSSITSVKILGVSNIISEIKALKSEKSQVNLNQNFVVSIMKCWTIVTFLVPQSLQFHAHC